MASLRKKPNSKYFIACFRDSKERKTQMSTFIADEGSPKERAQARKNALSVARGYEDTARGNLTEAGVRKTMAELFQKVNKRRLVFAQTDEFLKAWVGRAKRLKAGRTHEKYEFVVRTFLESLGDKASRSLGDVTIEDVQAFVNRQLEAGKSPQSVRGDTKILNVPFTRALRQGLIITNPVAGAELPEGAHETRNPFTWDEVRSLVKVAPSEWKTAIMLGAYVGARLGDCVTMRWRSVDLPKKIIRFRPSKTGRRGKDVLVPIHPSLEEHLLSLPGADSPDAFLCPTLAKTRIPGRSGLSRKFTEIMADAGIENETVKLGEGPKARHFNRYGFHSIRHTFNSVLTNANVPQELRMALCGHASESVNEVYSHRGVALLREAVGRLPAF